MLNKGNLDAAKYEYEYELKKLKEFQTELLKNSGNLYQAKLKLVKFIEQQDLDQIMVKNSNDIVLRQNIREELTAFQVVRKTAQDSIDQVNGDGSSALGGLFGGFAAGLAGVAAPGAIMGLITTFGVASTGTAISTLSGAALTSASLAAVGGGSMAAGSILMGALGPIGLAVGAGIAGFSLFSANKKNKEKTYEYINETTKVKESTVKMKNINNSIVKLERIINTGLPMKTNNQYELSELMSLAELLNTEVVG